jgi:hypothetical protein
MISDKIKSDDFLKILGSNQWNLYKIIIF